MPIFKTLHNDFIKPINKYILTFVMLIIFAIAGYIGFKWFIKPTIENLDAEDIANSNRRISDAKIMFFSADWCPHCNRAKPDWDKFKNEFNNKEVGHYKILTEQVDCTEGDDPKIQEYSIDGYPTVILLKDGQRVDYDAKINYDNLDQFVSQFLNN